MDIKKVYENLCWYDPRNPDYVKPDDNDIVSAPRKNCSCDNCFYGRDKLAMEILDLKDVIKQVTQFQEVQNALEIKNRHRNHHQ